VLRRRPGSSPTKCRSESNLYKDFIIEASKAYGDIANSLSDNLVMLEISTSCDGTNLPRDRKSQFFPVLDRVTGLPKRRVKALEQRPDGAGFRQFLPEPILSRDLFEDVQEKLAANAVARQVRLRGSAALLTGRLFDDRGNCMSPTHANKKGAR
jgi:hypothetical protein